MQAPQNTPFASASDLHASAGMTSLDPLLNPTQPRLTSLVAALTNGSTLHTRCRCSTQSTRPVLCCISQYPILLELILLGAIGCRNHHIRPPLEASTAISAASMQCLGLVQYQSPHTLACTHSHTLSHSTGQPLQPPTINTAPTPPPRSTTDAGFPSSVKSKRLASVGKVPRSHASIRDAGCPWGSST